MKKNTHPQYNAKTVIVCNTCKTEYILGSTATDIRVELCANCHPFYTGKEMLVDTDNLVEKFNKKKTLAQNLKPISKKEKRLNKKTAKPQNAPMSLKDMLSQIK